MAGPPPSALAAYRRLVAAVQDVELKGASLPYTSMNGNMFSFLDASGTAALRLAETDRDAFIAAFDSRLHEAHGRVMKEYVTVPPAILEDTATLSPWFERSVAHVRSLKPKATTRQLLAGG